jgi:hypothetical protein
VLREGVGLAVGDVALAAEHLEVEAEDLVHLAVPVVHEAGWDDHQRAVQLAPARQLAEEQRRLDGLAEAHLVGDEVAARRGRRDAVGQHHLVREQVDRRRVSAAALSMRGSACASYSSHASRRRSSPPATELMTRSVRERKGWSAVTRRAARRPRRTHRT